MPISHRDRLRVYGPPGHSGTKNVRLAEKDFCANFEFIEGVIDPGGEADPHAHDKEHQVIYVLEGMADVTLGDAPVERCGPGAIITIPPGEMHKVVSLGPDPLRMMIIYSPPLPPREDVTLSQKM